MTNIFIKMALGFAAIMLSASVAFAALTLDAAKQQGLVGEKPDGTLGIVSTATPDVKALVDSTNAERMVKYQAIAAKNGTGIDQVKALAGQKLIAGAKPGEYIMNASGGWQQK